MSGRYLLEFVRVFVHQHYHDESRNQGGVVHFLIGTHIGHSFLQLFDSFIDLTTGYFWTERWLEALFRLRTEFLISPQKDWHQVYTLNLADYAT